MERIKPTWQGNLYLSRGGGSCFSDEAKKRKSLSGAEEVVFPTNQRKVKVCWGWNNFLFRQNNERYEKVGGVQDVTSRRSEEKK